MKIPGQQRKAISPIVATVLIIAATLIAAAAILGYVFGIFGSASNTANVSIVGATIPSGVTVTASTFTVACATATGAGTISWSNTGSAGATASTVFLTYGGNTYNGAVPAACAPLAASSSGNIYITVVPVAPVKGNAFNGYVTLSNGAQASFTGTFS